MGPWVAYFVSEWTFPPKNCLLAGAQYLLSSRDIKELTGALGTFVLGSQDHGCTLSWKLRQRRQRAFSVIFYLYICSELCFNLCRPLFSVQTNISKKERGS